MWKTHSTDISISSSIQYSYLLLCNSRIIAFDSQATGAIQAIGLYVFGGYEAYWNFEARLKAFSKMCNLNNVHIPNGLNHRSIDLRYLEWHGYSSKYLSSSFQPKELVELKLRFSKLDHLYIEVILFFYCLSIIYYLSFLQEQPSIHSLCI